MDEERDENSHTPLLNAMLNRNVKKCRELVRLGADLHKPASIDSLGSYRIEQSYMFHIVTGYNYFIPGGPTERPDLTIYDFFNLLLFNGVDPNDPISTYLSLKPPALRYFVDSFGQHDIHIINRLCEAGTKITHVTDEDDYTRNAPFLYSLHFRVCSSGNTVQLTFELDLIVSNIH